MPETASDTEPDSTVWDLAALRRKFGRLYDIFPAGAVICAYREGPEGRVRLPLRAMTAEGLRAKILADIARIPAQRQEQ